MFECKRYRSATTYKIVPNKNNLRDARDDTFQLWKKQKAFGNIKFENVIYMHCSNEDEIIVTFEFEGLKDKTNTFDEIIPIYNFILKKYNPDDVHLSSKENIAENTFPFIIRTFKT